MELVTNSQDIKTEQQENKKEILGGLIPVSEWNKYYMYPSVNALRQLIFHNEKGFRDKCIKTIGQKRQYIDVEAFKQWAKGGEE